MYSFRAYVTKLSAFWLMYTLGAHTVEIILDVGAPATKKKLGKVQNVQAWAA